MWWNKLNNNSAKIRPLEAGKDWHTEVPNNNSCFDHCVRSNNSKQIDWHYTFFQVLSKTTMFSSYKGMEIPCCLNNKNNYHIPPKNKLDPHLIRWSISNTWKMEKTAGITRDIFPIWLAQKNISLNWNSHIQHKIVLRMNKCIPSNIISNCWRI